VDQIGHFGQREKSLMAKKKKEPPSELANIETLELKAQLSRPSSSMNEETSFIEDIKTEWNLFWETLLGDEEDQAEAAAEACGISKRKALRIIETKTGTTVGTHMWRYRLGSHGVRHYTLTIHG
jgi:hypothetical protein